MLNKIDLVPPAVVTAWRHFFSHRYPQLEVVCFTSFPKDEDERNADSDETSKCLIEFYSQKSKKFIATVKCNINGILCMQKSCEDVSGSVYQPWAPINFWKCVKSWLEIKVCHTTYLLYFWFGRKNFIEDSACHILHILLQLIC